MTNTNIPAITKNADGDLEYDINAINEIAMHHSIAPDALRAFAYDAVTVELTAAQLAQAYFDDKEANEETRRDAARAAVEELLNQSFDKNQEERAS